MYDQTGYYNAEVLPLVGKLKKICMGADMPYIAVFAVADNGWETSYRKSLNVSRRCTGDLRMSDHRRVGRGIPIAPRGHRIYEVGKDFDLTDVWEETSPIAKKIQTACTEPAASGGQIVFFYMSLVVSCAAGKASLRSLGYTPDFDGTDVSDDHFRAHIMIDTGAVPMELWRSHHARSNM